MPTSRSTTDLSELYYFQSFNSIGLGSVVMSTESRIVVGYEADRSIFTHLGDGIGAGALIGFFCNHIKPARPFHKIAGRLSLELGDNSRFSDGDFEGKPARSVVLLEFCNQLW